MKKTVFLLQLLIITAVLSACSGNSSRGYPCLVTWDPQDYTLIEEVVNRGTTCVYIDRESGIKKRFDYEYRLTGNGKDGCPQEHPDLISKNYVLIEEESGYDETVLQRKDFNNRGYVEMDYELCEMSISEDVWSDSDGEKNTRISNVPMFFADLSELKEFCEEHDCEFGYDISLD